MQQLNRYGIDGLLNPDPDGEASDLRRQLINHEFFDDYGPDEDFVEKPVPKEKIEFSYSGAYSLYNWELFFHAPFLIANSLSNNQRFEEAQKWYHYIFDPTDVSSDPFPARFWKIKPFYMGVNLFIQWLKETSLTEKEEAIRENLERQINEWRANPFSPHLLARMRIVPYMKAIVMKYLDNLIAWGDHLFRQDTIESINEATQLYILAAQILGKRPEDIPTPDDKIESGADDRDKTFNDLEPYLDEFGSFFINIETAVPVSTEKKHQNTLSKTLTDTKTIFQDLATEVYSDSEPNICEEIASAIEGKASIVEDEPPTSLVVGPTLFFCIPRNETLLSYWDTVADRLFKIRYCMNIKGVVRQLPLFQPPIEPGLLVRAVAAGVDISSALNDLNAPLPHYRFQIMLQKAVELCADVKSLGAALLTALEKRDAEELALLRSTHEVNLLKAVRQVKELQIKEAKEALEALERSKETVEKRKEYYESREYANVNEKLHITKLESAQMWETQAQVLELEANMLGIMPDFDIGIEGYSSSPTVKARWGGSNILSMYHTASRAMSLLASQDQHSATMASIKGGWDRRMDDWKFQTQQADKEIEQIKKQISAAEIRLAIAEQELENHDLQTENAKEVDAYMRDKFTNKQLYNWMVSQISTIYFQSYQMAYDLAKRAEKGFQHEIGDADSTFIQFGYWDSLKKGLLAGERLHYDLKRMEVAYYDQNKREYEITKHISLAMLHPEALVMLKETGECYFNLPEAIYDLDYPGHYMRRIKSASLTVPCVTGPYTNVSCTLTLLSNSIRQEPSTTSEFIENVGGIQSIATSSAREDSGLFELNFRDERYLPFEGAGAISTWRIELPTKFKQFDYDTISDVVIHVRYTAREGGEAFKQTVEDSLNNALNEIILEVGKTGLFRLFSAKREFPNQWHKFLHPKAGKANHMDLQLEEKFFPFQFKGKITEITCQKLFVKLKDAISTQGPSSFKLTLRSPDETDFVASFGITGDKLLKATFENTVSIEFGTWTLSVTELPDSLKVSNHLNPEAVEDIGILCSYSIEVSHI